MEILLDFLRLLIFPGGLFLLLAGLLYEWVDRKLLAQLQNRIGPRWFQPIADIVKLMGKEEVIPDGSNKWLFVWLPIAALAGGLTAALYVPIMGIKPAFNFTGDLIVTLYLLSLLTLCMGLAGSNTMDRFSVLGATRTFTQLFSYEAPFMLALLGPALVAGSWQIDKITAYTESHWLIFTQPIGFIVVIIGLMGKLELPPFDAPEAETEIVAGALTEYSGRGLALFRLGKGVEMVVGLTLVAAFYLGGVSNPLTVPGKNSGFAGNRSRPPGSPIALAHRSDGRHLVALRRPVGFSSVVIHVLGSEVNTMKLGTMLSDVTHSFFRRNITQKYPFERFETPERLRGHLHWDSEKCTGCGMCGTDCPAAAIKMHVLDKKAKRFVMEYHIDQCTFCAQCVHSCNQDCLSMQKDVWELAALNRDPLVVYFGDPNDVIIVQEGLPEPEPEPASE